MLTLDYLKDCIVENPRIYTWDYIVFIIPFVDLKRIMEELHQIGEINLIDMSAVSNRQELDYDFVWSTYKKYDWDWNFIIRNAPMQFIIDIDNTGLVDWDWHFIQYNKHLTPFYIKQFINKLRCWDLLDDHVGIDITFIRIYYVDMRFVWNLTDITSRPDISPDFVDWCVTINKSSYCDWVNISRLMPFTYIFSRRNDPRYNWMVLYMSANKQIGEYIDNMIILYGGRLHWQSISKNADLKSINGFDLYPWNFNCLSNNATLTQDIVIEYINKDWNWITLTSNPGISMKFIYETFNNPLYHWNTRMLSRKHSIDDSGKYLELLLEKNIGLLWEWEWLTYNSDISKEFIDEHPRYNWVYLDRLRKYVKNNI